jgi:hypothetical protein
MDVFWIYNPKILVDKYYEILPTKQMERIRQMNTISRLLIYLIILNVLFSGDSIIILICLSMIIMIIIFYFINKSDEKGVGKDLITESNKEIEKYTNINKSCDSCGDKIYNNKSINYSINKIYENSSNPITKTPVNSNVLLESGYIDFDGNYKIGRDFSDVSLKNTNNQTPKISWDKYKYYADNTCRKPTVDNPFTNIAWADYLDAGNLAEPCNVNDSSIQKNINYLYNSSIYRNIEDVFERENSQRTFYSVPITTIPNKQTEFAEWLYKTGPTCKENSQNCTYFEEPYMVSQRY